MSFKDFFLYKKHILNNKKLVIGITAPQSTMLLKGQLKYFVSKGYDVYLLAPKYSQTIEFCKKEGATLLPIFIKREISPLHDLRSLFQIIAIFRKVKPDIVNLGTPKVSLLGMIAAKIIGVKKRIYTCRGFRFEHETGGLKKLLIFLEKVTASSSNKVLCISQSVKDLGVENGIFSEKKSIIINKGSSNGIDLRVYNKENVNDLKLQGLKRKYNLEDKFVFGFLGRIVERKGFKELIDAFDRVYQNDKNVKLLVVGRPYYDQIDKATIEKANLHPGIEMVGLVDYEETPYYYSLMDVFVLPAYWEGFGNVLIQAAAFGLPIITTNVTGCKDAVLDKYNGTHIQTKNVDILYKTMLEFQNSPELLLKYSLNGLKWVNNFKPETIWAGMDKHLYAN
jgi:glycosyltransferase involved in cell wall biosynthesis